ncbi:MAG: hypothetical protein IMF07_04115 [Proteobacteria bacterium]|nr:hypothetical protein [Pseudomonadota bacterium]
MKTDWDRRAWISPCQTALKVNEETTMHAHVRTGALAPAVMPEQRRLITADICGSGFRISS